MPSRGQENSFRTLALRLLYFVKNFASAEIAVKIYHFRPRRGAQKFIHRKTFGKNALTEIVRLPNSDRLNDSVSQQNYHCADSWDAISAISDVSGH